MSEQDTRGRVRYVALGASLLLLVGIVTAVGDVFRTSHPVLAGDGGPATLVVRDFNFTPHAIVVEHGRTATVVLRDESVHAHTFTSPELRVDVTVKPGKTRSVTVTAPGSGEFGFYCRFHQASNMRGYIQFRG